jgi:hypothetical protein
MTDQWPTASLGNVGRLRALTAAYKASVIVERTIPASFDRVWEYFADMERSVPSFDETVAEFRITERIGNHLTARVRGPLLPIRFTLDVDLEPGWCIMTARPVYYLVAFAAEPAGDQTLFAHAEACNIPGPKALRRIGAPILTPATKWLRGHVTRDIDGLERELEIW